MLTQDIITAVRTLLGRAQLTGAEVPAYNKIMLALAAEENSSRLREQEHEQERLKPVGVPNASDKAA